MGNRASVVFTNEDATDISPAVYLHWNGGPESVYAFLAELERRGVREDTSYRPARFAQIVGEFFSADPNRDRSGAYGLSLGIYPAPESISLEGLGTVNPGDNGVYVVRGASAVHHYTGHPLSRMDKAAEHRERVAAYRSATFAGITGVYVALAEFRGESDAAFVVDDESVQHIDSGEVWPA